MEMLPQPIFSSTFVCIITIFSILLLLPPSYSDDNCSLDFRWGHCEKDVPTIDLGPDGSFFLQPANPSDYTLTIASMNFKAFICPETPQNKILPLPLLKFSETNKNLPLFYNCNPPHGLLPESTTADCEPNTAFPMNYSEHSELEGYNHSKCYTVEVTVNHTVFNKVQEGELTLLAALEVWFDGVFNGNAFLFHKWERLDEICWSLVQHSNTKFYQRPPAPGLGNEEFRRSCNISAVIPVMKTAVKRFVNHGLSVGEVVNQGLEVNRNVEAEQCRSCLKTGGSCGFNSTLNQFRCFCDGGDFCPSRMPVVPASQFDTPGAPPVPDPIPTPAMCFLP